MSIMAGIFRRDRSSQIPEEIRESVKRVLSRREGDRIDEYTNNYCFVAKLDIGAYGHPAFYEDSGGFFSGLTGETLLTMYDKRVDTNRDKDLKVLHEAWKKENWHILSRVNGLFCGIHYNPESHALYLLCDKHGLRPFYYWESEEYVIFSTALRILESLNEIPKKADVQALMEMQALKFPLFDHTPYVDIKRIQAGEIIEFKSRGTKKWYYWKWDGRVRNKLSKQELLEELYSRFKTAVKRRLHGNKVAVCALSGGLDSRCIVGALRDLKITVYAFNFAPPHTQDEVLARRFADEIGCHYKHISLNKETDDPLDPIRQIYKAWVSTHSGGQDSLAKPLMLWLGAGGSVGLGFVYMTKTMVELIRNNEIDRAIRLYLEVNNLMTDGRFLKPKISQACARTLRANINEALVKLDCDDPARKLYLFLMLYEQRSLFMEHYEEIDLHRVEIHAPFFDSDFFEAILSCPVDSCLNHHLYNKWLELFPRPVSSVPWQSYPGHEPCPHNIPDDLIWQWDGAYRTPEREVWLRKKRLKKAVQMLKQGHFPTKLARKWYFVLAVLLYRFGLRDYGWLIDRMDYISKYWSKTKGAHDLNLVL